MNAGVKSSLAYTPKSTLFFFFFRCEASFDGILRDGKKLGLYFLILIQGAKRRRRVPRLRTVTILIFSLQDASVPARRRTLGVAHRRPQCGRSHLASRSGRPHRRSTHSRPRPLPMSSRYPRRPHLARTPIVKMRSRGQVRQRDGRAKRTKTQPCYPQRRQGTRPSYPVWKHS